jgi:tetratricopeptide (TPR) repeat protein
MAPTAGKQDYQAVVASCNRDGMDSLHKGQLKAAFEQLKYAESLLIANQTEGEQTSLLAVTCNNLGCYYKKVGKLHGALSYLRRALQMETDLGTDEVTLAGTHLNVCALLSKLEKHDKALQHATCALDLLNQRVSKSEPGTVSHDDYSVLAIAYHNVAVERDFLHEYDKAAAALKQGFDVARASLGEDHPLAVTLGRNCEAVLQKSQKVTKAAPAAVSLRRPPQILPSASDPGAATEPKAVTLPSLPGVPPSPPAAAMPVAVSASARKDAADWVASEEQAWSNFAQAALGPAAGKGKAPVPLEAAPPRPAAESPLARRQLAPAHQKALQESMKKDLTATPFTTSGRSPQPTQTVDNSPEALMDLIDSDQNGPMVGTAREASNDYRPNRMIKGSTRTARVVRRTNLMTADTTCRDRILATRQILRTSGIESSPYIRQIAAERIQRAYRSWSKYCQENADWMATTWVAATMIQCRWRAYFVRRKKLDLAASCIQRHAHGFLVRRSLRKHKAAITIQRYVVGMLTRQQLLQMHRAARRMQALVRGGLGRKRVRARRAVRIPRVVIIQSAIRMSLTRRWFKARKEEARQRRKVDKAIVDIQRVFRGRQGRKKFQRVREKYLRDMAEYEAATKLQAMQRRRLAKERADQIRNERIRKMQDAATFLRKMWLGVKTRRRYQNLIFEFKRHERHIINIQRYTRGFLIRLRMWREAIRAEEELWAVLEIQRVFRGHSGRQRWEQELQERFRRDMAALMMQRHIRGWLARTRVGRLRRKIARAEFERARRRFRAAQHIQALVRGVQARKVIFVHRSRILGAVVRIQKHYRAHACRTELWDRIMHMRATTLQAAARGFLVRNRRVCLIAKVLMIERAWVRWKRTPEEVKEAARNRRFERIEKAAVIQRMFRSHSEAKEVGRVQQELQQQGI